MVRYSFPFVCPWKGYGAQRVVKMVSGIRGGGCCLAGAVGEFARGKARGEGEL